MNRYLLRSILMLLAFFGALVTLNYVIDPYAIYRYQDADTAQISRVDQFYHMRLSKPWQVTHRKPRQLVIGSSRAGVVTPAQSADSVVAYNLSMPGMTPTEMEQLVRHAHATGGLERLSIGIEPASFISKYPEMRSGFEPRRLKQAGTSANKLQWLLDAGSNLLSASATLNSLGVLSGTADVRRLYHPDGSWESKGGRLIGESGYLYNARALVQQVGLDSAGMVGNLAVFSRVLEFAYANKIKTRIFVSPEHIYFIDLWYRLGYLPQWEQFHRELVTIVESLATEHDMTPFDVYGFNLMLGVIDEPIYKGRGDPDAWLKDGIHFDKRLGARIMSSLWGRGVDQALPKDDAVKLTTTSVDRYLADTNLLRLSFLDRDIEMISYYNNKLGID